MTTLTAPRPLLDASDRGALTLGKLLDGTWQELQAHGNAACPVCGEGMTAGDGAGRCDGCGSELR